METSNSVHISDNANEGKSVKNDNDKTTSLFLYFVATIANLNGVTMGATVIWISPVASKLSTYNSEENPLGRPITTLELSLIGSLSQTGMVLGPVLLERLFDQFGRKRSVNLLSLILVACYVSLAFSRNIYLYYVLIFLIGIFLGGNTVGVSMYISEITEDHNRGRVSCYGGSFMPLGNLYGFLLGPFLSVKIFTLLCVLPSLIMIIVSELFLPESPQYLINQGKREEARKTIRKLLGSNESRTEKVAAEIEFNVCKTKKVNTSNIKELFTNKSSRNGLIMCCILSSLTAFSGIPAIMSYLQLIFETAGTKISASTCTVIIGVIQIFCYFTASVLVEKWGRRSLLLYSAITTSIPLSILGTYFCLINIGSPIVENIRWVPIVGIMFLMITAITGICSVPAAYLNEVFISDVKSIAMSFVYFISGIIIAGLVFLFPIMMETIGLDSSFWIFAVLCIFAFVFVYFRVPETKGKNILEIQNILSK